MKIALLIGHRVSSQGARSVKRISEFAFWYTFLHTIVHVLPSHHRYRVFERLDSDGRGYRERMKSVGKRAQEWGADLIISFHFNASRNVKAEGFEVLCPEDDYISEAYALDMLSCFEEHLRTPNRGLKRVPNDPDVRGSGFLYQTPMPSILVEPFFGTNWEDFKNATQEGRLAAALIDFME